MPTTIHRPATQPRAIRRVSPSIVDPATAEPFTLEQELKPFGAWVGKPIWVPPKDSSKTLAETMLRESRPFASQDKRWASVVKKHRSDFTQVRELDLFQASIRLPKGKILCHGYRAKALRQNYRSDTQLRANPPGGILKRTRHEAGREGVLPQTALRRSWRRADPHHGRRPDGRHHQGPRGSLCGVSTAGALPPAAGSHGGCRQPGFGHSSRGGEICRRAQTKGHRCAPGSPGIRAKKAGFAILPKTYRKFRTDGCTFDEVLELTSPLKRTDVIDQYCTEQELSAAKRAQLLRMAAGTVPWFVALSLTVSFRFFDSPRHVDGAAAHRLRPSFRRRNARLRRRGPEDWSLRRSRRHHPRRDLRETVQ